MAMTLVALSWVVSPVNTKIKAKSNAQSSVRLAALHVANSVISGRASLATALPQWNEKVARDDRALLMELSYGVARWSIRLSALMTQLMDKPLRKKDQDVAVLIQLGLYQLAYMRIPEHAAINTTVAVATELRKPWAKGLVNAVLRNYLRNKDHLESTLTGFAAEAFPQWLGEQLKKDWPDDWPVMLTMANKRPPMILRVNLSCQSREDYIKRLNEAGLQAIAGAFTDSAVVLQEPVSVERLPGFSAGHVSVQDTAAQLAAELLSASSDERILDACAAPGGKTCHLLERSSAVSVVALDNVEARLQRVRDNANRLSLAARLECICANAEEVDAWWDGNQFDAVLLDAPCSGTGVLRRHPDIKLTRRPTDIATLVALQQTLLRSLWTVLKPGGRILYATCSLLKAENEMQIQHFLDAQPDATLVPLKAHVWGRDQHYGRQILLNTVDADGFFYSLITKAP